VATSNQYSFAPPISDLIVESFERLQIYSPAFTERHIISARRSANLILSGWANRGIDLFSVDTIAVPMVPGQLLYALPIETVNVLDAYIRTYTASTTKQALGSALTAVVDQNGAPIVSAPYGDPVVQQPGLGSLSCTAGSQLATLLWPAHGLSVGSPLIWGCPVTVGGLSLPPLSIVSNVADWQTLQFLLPSAALESAFGGGGTPLFFTTSGSSTVGCIQTGHGLTVGQSFTVPISTTVGGLTLLGTYTVASVQSSYQFSFAPGGAATATAVAFENGGQISVASQAAGVDATDVLVYPISRNDYAALPDKFAQGRPTSFWFDRIVPPVINVWPAPPPNSLYGFVAYRMREIQDANPSMGQTLDAPRRFLPVFAAELTAALAEKFAPAQWKEKRAAAAEAWMEAAMEDREKVTSRVAPDMSAYFR
jgi:hypothetical protein